MKNLEIKKIKDCWGCEIYIGYIDGKQFTDGYDYLGDLKEDYPEFKNIKVK